MTTNEVTNKVAKSMALLAGDVIAVLPAASKESLDELSVSCRNMISKIDDELARRSGTDSIENVTTDLTDDEISLIVKGLWAIDVDYSGVPELVKKLGIE